MRTCPVFTALTTAVLVVLTGCSATSATSPNEPREHVEVKAAARAYSDAYYSDDAIGMYHLLTKRCAEGAGSIELLREKTSKVSHAVGFQRIERIAVDDLAGDIAHVSYIYEESAFNQKRLAFRREEGTWRFDGC